MKELLGVKETSKYLGVPISWIYDRVRVGAIPYYKIGKYVRFDPQEIKAWLETQRKGPRLDNSIYKDKLPLSIVNRKEVLRG